MILHWLDHEGDPVAVESAAIIGMSVGDLNGPQRTGAGVRVTLIWAAGVPQPFMVDAPFDEVFRAWVTAGSEKQPPLTESEAQTAYPGVFPLVAHQYDLGGAQ